MSNNLKFFILLFFYVITFIFIFSFCKTDKQQEIINKNEKQIMNEKYKETETIESNDSKCKEKNKRKRDMDAALLIPWSYP